MISTFEEEKAHTSDMENYERFGREKMFKASRECLTKSHQVRGKKVKAKKKPTKSQLNKKADIEWSRVVKERAGNKCEVCGITTHLQSHHIFSRVNHSVRWDVHNGICLCPSHHLFSHTMSAHKASVEFVEWFKGYRGLESYELLRSKARSIKSEV